MSRRIKNYTLSTYYILGLAYKDNELHEVVHNRDICPVLIACANCMNTSDNIKNKILGG